MLGISTSVLPSLAISFADDFVDHCASVPPAALPHRTGLFERADRSHRIAQRITFLRPWWQLRRLPHTAVVETTGRVDRRPCRRRSQSVVRGLPSAPLLLVTCVTIENKDPENQDSSSFQARLDARGVEASRRRGPRSCQLRDRGKMDRWCRVRPTR